MRVTLGLRTSGDPAQILKKIAETSHLNLPGLQVPEATTRWDDTERPGCFQDMEGADNISLEGRGRIIVRWQGQHDEAGSADNQNPISFTLGPSPSGKTNNR